MSLDEESVNGFSIGFRLQWGGVNQVGDLSLEFGDSREDAVHIGLPALGLKDQLSFPFRLERQAAPVLNDEIPDLLIFRAFALRAT